jgi:MFS family permease
VGLLDGLGGGVLGTVLAPVILIAVTLHWSWRAAFLIASAIAIVSAALLARILKPNSADEVRYETDASEAAGGIGQADIETDQRKLVLCCLICTAMIGWLILTSTFYPTYLLSVLHRSETEMTLLMSVMGTGSLAATFLIPTLSDHFGRRPVMIACHILGAVGPVALLLAPESFSLMLIAMAIGGLAAGTFPLFLAVIPAESVSAKRLPWTIGIIQACGELGGGVLTPAVAGWAAVHFEPAAPVQMALGATLLASVLSFALTERPKLILQKL